MADLITGMSEVSMMSLLIVIRSVFDARDAYDDLDD